jgi:UDP-glucose 4-epimerase
VDAIARVVAGADVVYHLAAVAHEAAAESDPDTMRAVNVEAPLRWLRAAERAGVPRFVWVSTIKVLGDVSAAPLTPDSPCRPGNAYARGKREAEERLLAEPLAATSLAVVRPPLVYGPGVRGNFLTMLRWGARGWPLPLAGATAPRSVIAVANLCHLLHRLAADGSGIFHAADAEDVCVAELVAELRRLMGCPVRQFAMPDGLLRAAAGALGRGSWYARLFEPLQVDIGATRSRLGWSPPMARQQALEETVAWFSSSR